MDIYKLSTKFKICVSTNQFTRALEYLQKISSFFEELMEEDLKLIRKLCKGLIEQNKKSLEKLKKTKAEENSKSFLKVPLRDVLNDYSENLICESITLIESFLHCVNILSNKTKNKILQAQIFLIKAKLFKFLYTYSNMLYSYLYFIIK